MSSTESPPLGQQPRTTFTPSPPLHNELFTPPPPPQEMEGIQMVMAGLEAANLSMTIDHDMNGQQFPFQDGNLTNLPTLPLSPDVSRMAPVPFPNEMHPSGQDLFSQPTSYPGSATTSPPPVLYQFPSPMTSDSGVSVTKHPATSSSSAPLESLVPGSGSQTIHVNNLHSAFGSPVSSTFAHHLAHALSNNVVSTASGAADGTNRTVAVPGVVNGQSSEEHAVPSGYATPQSSGPGLLDFPPNIVTSTNTNQAVLAPASGIGEDRNVVILDLARRLQQSLLFLSHAVQAGQDAEVETQLAHIDQLSALMKRNGIARRDAVSPPSSSQSMPPPPVPMNQLQQQSPPGHHTNGMTGEEVAQQLQQQLSRPPSPKPTNMMGLLLDNEASRKRCASAVTDGDRIIKSLKIETKESQQQQQQQQQPQQQSQQQQLPTTRNANPSLIGMMPPPLQVGLGEMPPPSSIGPLSSTSFMTPLTPSSNDPFFAHPTPLTPASSVHGGPPSSFMHNAFGVVTSNPPSQPCSRPPSPSVLRHIQPPQLPHSVPSMAHHSPPMPTLANSQFTMDHRGVSWSDLTAVAAAAAGSAQPSMAYAAYNSVPSTAPVSVAGSGMPPVSQAQQQQQQQQQPQPPPPSSYPPSATSTPARPRQSRSSSYSRGENKASSVATSAVAPQAVVPSDHHAMDGVVPSGYVTPVTTKMEEHEMDFFVSGTGSYSASFSLSAPHSPHSTSSEESFEMPGLSSPATKVLPSNAPAVMAMPTLHGHHPSSSIDSTISVDEFAEVKHIPNPNHPGNEIPPEYKHDVERIFFEFLNRICSNLDATDSKGELIHQTLMAKKMQRLDESPDFRPFKFRIQAFTNAFLEELARQGYPEDKLPMKKVRGYLWIQPFISRYNEDGKKAKSKGNHIWNIDAKKHPEGGWIFRRFHRKIAGSPPGVAYQGLLWSYKPHIWDPQQSRKNETVHYSSSWLPTWLRWDRDTLTGTPPEDADSTDITVEARFTENGVPELLSTTFHLTVAPINAGDVNATNALGVYSRPPVSGENGLGRRVNSDSLVPSFATLPQRPPLPRQTTRVNMPPPTGSSRVVEVLNDATGRVMQNQNVASLSFAEPQVHASLSRQQQVLAVTSAAIEGTVEPFSQQNIQTNAIANVGTQFVASTVEVLMQERRAMSSFTVSPEPNLTVQEVSKVTQNAIAHAVNSLPVSSSEVEVLMAAKAFVQTTRGNNAHPEPQLISPTFTSHPTMQDLSTYPHGTVLPPPP